MVWTRRLWAFVGSKVNAVYTEKKKSRSDVLNVIRFLHRFLKNEKAWAIHSIEKIINGDSGLSDDNGTDVFQNRLSYLKERNETPRQIYTDILDEVFHTNSSGALHLCDVRNARGEIALKATSSSQYFGLIYIGDTSAFKKLVQNDDADISMDSENVFTESLFNDINKPESAINILIGAKKFIEGWDSWRVTAMGLLNIGRQEGSQIIQLFGRGVRLRGRNMSLRRSTPEDTERPDNLPLLETLNIFAVRANFMAQFQDYLMREGVPHEEPIQLELPIKRNMDRIPRPLYVPTVLQYAETATGKCVMLEVNSAAAITHTTQSVDIIGSSTQRGIQAERAEAAHQTHIPQPSLELVDWEYIYLQLLEYKKEKQFHNLIFDIDILKQILSPNEGLSELSVMDESEVVPRTQAQLKRLEELVLTLLRKYIAKFYRIIQKRWNDEAVRLKKLEGNDSNFTNWKVYIPRDEASELEPQIKHLIESKEIYGSGTTKLSKVYNDRHLYQPLLTVDGVETALRITPPALENSEKDFVNDLQKYVHRQHEELLAEKQIFLLRNQSRGKGIGFYENEGFYPDFILWILEGAKQRIVFIEPHGMIHDAINEHNDKITLFKRLRDLSHKRFRGEHVQMDAFMISRTTLTNIQRRYPDENRQTFAEEWHILFRDPVNLDYLSPIFQDSDPDTSI